MREILRENKFQIRKWGIADHDAFQWLAFTTEELGELAAAIADHHFRNASAKNVIHEAIQTATLCLKIAEMYMALEEEGT